LRKQAKMIRTLLSDEVWARIESVLPGKEGDSGRTASDNRWFVEAVLWIGRTGCPWRGLPKAFGRWHTVYMRFSRLRRKGVWERVIHAVADETGIRHVLIDSAIVRAPQHSSGARKKRGQASDITCVNELVEHLRTGAVIADKGYDSDAFVEYIRATRAKGVIPPCSNRKTKCRYSRVLYQTRNIVERFFGRIKHFRRVATRYDKLAGNYLAFALQLMVVRRGTAEERRVCQPSCALAFLIPRIVAWQEVRHVGACIGDCLAEQALGRHLQRRVLLPGYRRLRIRRRGRYSRQPERCPSGAQFERENLAIADAMHQLNA
jgi:transposase